LRPPLTEEELLNLEQSHRCVLPDPLREMYLSFDGEHTEWGPMGDLSGWGGGLANGLRLLPLAESLSLGIQSHSELPIPSPER
jgi:cell wall assembly regulator SMI1